MIDNPVTIRQLREANDEIRDLKRGAAKEKAKNLDDLSKIREKHRKEIDFIKAEKAVQVRQDQYVREHTAAERRDAAWDKKHDPEAWARRQTEEEERAERNERMKAISGMP